MTTKPNTGLYWHVDRDTLLGYCCNPYLSRQLKPVQGELPDAVTEAFESLDKAIVAVKEADAALDKAFAAYDKAIAACDKAEEALNKAITDNMPALLELHAKECGCGWTVENSINLEMLGLLKDILGWHGILPHSKTRIKDVIAKAEGK
jgi:exonuclease VII small subunit